MPVESSSTSASVEACAENAFTAEMVQAKTHILDLLRAGSISEALKIRTANALPADLLTEAEVRDAVYPWILQSVRNLADLSEFKQTLTELGVSHDIFLSQEVRHAMAEGVIRRLSLGLSPERTLRTVATLQLSDEVLRTQNGPAAVITGVCVSLRAGNGMQALAFVDLFSLSPEVLTSDEVTQAARQGMARCLFTGLASLAHDVQDSVSLPDKVARPIAEVARRFLLNEGKREEANQVSLSFELARHELAKEDVDSAACDVVSWLLTKNTTGRFPWKSPEDVVQARKVAEACQLPNEVWDRQQVRHAAKKALIQELAHGTVEAAQELLRAFPLARDDLKSEDVVDAIATSYKRALAEAHMFTDVAFLDLSELAYTFSMPPAFFEREDLQVSAQKALEALLDDGKIDAAAGVMDFLHIHKEGVDVLIQKAIRDTLSHNEIRIGIQKVNKLARLFNVPPANMQVAARQALLYCVASRDAEDVLILTKHFPFHDDVFTDTALINEGRKQVLERLHDYNLGDADWLADSLRLSAEDRENLAMKAFDKVLREKGDARYAMQLQKHYFISDERVRTKELYSAALSGLKAALNADDLENASLIVDTWELGSAEVQGVLDTLAPAPAYYWAYSLDEESSYVQKKYAEAVAHLEEDHFYAPKMKLARELWGAEWNIILKENTNFWIHPHQNMLFLEKVGALAAEERQDLFTYVLQPLVSRDFLGFESLNEQLGYFSIREFKKRHGNAVLPLTSFDEFRREAEMQRYSIELPADASPRFSDAVHHMLMVKGVDVPFLRTLIDVYKGVVKKRAQETLLSKEESVPGHETPRYGWRYDALEDDDVYAEIDEDEYENAEIDEGRQEMNEYQFARRLVDSIEGWRPLAEVKRIKPWAEYMPLDPLHSLVSTAVGIHSLNSVTVRLREFVGPHSPLAPIEEILAAVHTETQRRIEEVYKNKVETQPQQKDRLMAERNNRLKKERLILAGPGETVAGIAEFHDQNWRFLLESKAGDLREALLTACENRQVRQLLLQALADLANKHEAIETCIDLIPFRDALTDMAKEISSTYDKDSIQSATQEDLQRHFAGSEVALSAYLLYLGLNNRTRQTQSKTFKASIDRIVKQPKYAEQLAHCKERGLVDKRADVFVAYTRGLIQLMPSDEAQIQQVLGQAGIGMMGRQIKAEIAHGDDWTAWTCGDETDCCMPLTSEKNMEYLVSADTAYFLVKLVHTDGTENTIASSVLVEAKDEAQPEKKVLAVDNIEIANRALHLRMPIKAAYDALKAELVRRYGTEKVRLIIGTTYNDDGGVITGSLPLVTNHAVPLAGPLEYSDCFESPVAYEWYSDEKRSSWYTGLAKDLFEHSEVQTLLKNQQERNVVRELLDRVGQGVDDGDGGMLFGDNYSGVLMDGVDGEKPIGYVIACNYVDHADGGDDYVHIERIGWAKGVSPQQAKQELQKYLQYRGLLDTHESRVQGLVVTAGCKESFPEFGAWLRDFFPEHSIAENSDGELVVAF